MIVKVCGMRDSTNIRAIEGTGVDWMGFIFFEKSPRNVATRPSYLPSHCKRVGVFVNATFGFILQKAETFGLDHVQLHGDESTDFCSSLRQSLPRDKGIIKMIPVSKERDLEYTQPYEGLVDYFLFDTKQPIQASYFGGSGESFDWNVLTHYRGDTPFIVSGGIRSQDVEKVRRIRHPKFFGVDLNSRFEISPAVKDAARIQAFVHQLKQPEPIAF